MLDYELISDWGNKVYKNGDKVIKIYPSEEYKYAEESARRQRLAYYSGLPVPAVYGIHKISETEIGLEIQYVESKRFIYDGMHEQARLDAYEVMVKLQCMMYAVDASKLPVLTDFYIAEITENPYLTEQTKEKLLGLMRELDKGKTNLCHGDMHDHNIIFDGEKHWLIDWEDASKGDPAADACMAYFYVLRFNREYAERYLDIFCQESGTAREEVLAWLPVIAGVQSNINDENDRAFILNFLSDIL